MLQKFITKIFVWRAIGAALSGVLLAISFPPFDEWISGWFALVPLFFVARGLYGKRAFFWGFVSGMVFWLITLSWILATRHTGGPVVLVVLGWVSLAAYCSIYMGLFMLILCRLLRLFDGVAFEGQKPAMLVWIRRCLLWILVALAWVGVEYGRSVLFTGFPWNTMAISQYANLTLIQIASIGGVYAVSAVVVLMNGLIYATIARFVDVSILRRSSQEPRYAMTLGLVILVAIVFYGTSVIKARDADATEGLKVRVSAVQPNIPQDFKWYGGYGEKIFERLKNYTELAVMGHPDLVIWPETVLPGSFPGDEISRVFVTYMTRYGSALLVGSIEAVMPGSVPENREADAYSPVRGAERCYNSSFLVDKNDVVVNRYRKRHLVIVGEYIPMDKVVKVLQKLVPIGMSCTAGEESTVFDLDVRGRIAPFSVLICFEDAFAYLARDAVRNGARWLINQTNDGWFEGSQAAYQHMVHCVFRCVENGVPATRCGNTGVTCFIDSSGRIDQATRGQLVDGGYETTIYRNEIVSLPKGDMIPTFYTRYGDWPFAIPCALFALVMLAGCFLENLGLERGKKNRDTSASEETAND